MTKSLSSLWLKSLRRMGKAQEAQGRKLFQSLLPQPAARHARPVKTARAQAGQVLRKPPLRPARAATGLPARWKQAHFSVPGTAQLAPARRMLYWLYLPAGASPAPRPLVVMLHGCQQTATEFAAATRMNQLAERKGFAVLYPQQSTTTDAHRCWHWYKRATQQGQGDARLIADMIAHVQGKHGLDISRTYLAGLSAGAAMATLVALHHPDRIAALGLHSAPVFGTTDSAMSAYRAMQHGTSHTHIDAAEAVLRSQPQFPGLPAIVLHGERDTVVRRVNADQLSEQLKTLNAPFLGEAGPVLRSYPARSTGRSPRHAYQSLTTYAGRKPQLVICEVAGLGHAWSGGDGNVSFSAPEGPDASLMMWTFFSRHRRPAVQPDQALPESLQKVPATP